MTCGTTVLPWTVGAVSAAAFLLLCLARDVALVYTFNATLLFLLVAADLVFVLITGRLRLAASYKDGAFRACDLPTGRLIGACAAGLVLTVLVVGAASQSIGHPIRAATGWWASHYGEVGAAATDLWVLVAIVAVSISMGRAVKRRQWRRATSSFLGLLALSVLAATVVGAWLLARQHTWWPYLWVLSGVVIAGALGTAAIKGGEAADIADGVHETGHVRKPPSGARLRKKARARAGPRRKKHARSRAPRAAAGRQHRAR